MGRRDERPSKPRGEPRPNVLAEGNPVPNVLRGYVPPDTPGTQAGGPRAGGPAGQGSARRADEPGGGPAPSPGCSRARSSGRGCSGWLGLLFLFFVAVRLVGSCDELLGPATSSSPATPAPGTMVDVGQLAPGDCFAWSGESDGVAAVNVVDCSLAHDAEVTGITELPDPAGAPYDEAAVTAAAQVRCNAVFTAYAGVPALMSADAGSSFIDPGAEGWQQGDRTVVCLAESETPGSMVGSVRRTAAP